MADQTPDTKSDSHSVTLWIDRLKEGQADAASELWERYFNRLVSLARNRLGNAERRVVDEEDIATTVFYALCDGAKNGRFENLKDRHDLWVLLIAITSNKAVDQIRRQTSKKRGRGLVRGDSVLGARGDSSQDFVEIICDEPSPELLASMDEQFQSLLALLRDDLQRSIVLLRLAGHSNREIAEKVNISLRSVERKVEVIRDTWSSVLDDPQS
ncbi:MAG: sigma-70 family RNA polymerase sigma factor [Planctomycetota bacterium]